MSKLSAIFPQPDFKVLFESAPDAYLVLTPEFVIVAASNGYLRSTMTVREQIVGQHLFQVFPDNPSDTSATGVSNLRVSLERVLRDKTPDAMAVQKYDIRQPESQGGGFEERYWSPINSPVLDTGGDVLYIIHRVEDVTEFLRLKKAGSEQTRLTDELRNQAEEMEAEIYRRAQHIQAVNGQLRKELDARKRAEQEVDRFFSLSLDMLCISKSDGYFKRISPAFTRTLGWSVDEMLSRPFIEFVHPDDRVVTLNDVEKQIANGEQVLQFENRYHHRDGTWRTLSWKSVPQADGLMYATARDVTELKRAEAQFHMLLEAAPDATITVDGQGHINRINLQAEKLFGYQRAELIGRPIEMLIPERFRNSHPAHRCEYRKDPQSRGMGRGVDLFAISKTGTEIPVEISLSPLTFNDDFQVIAAIRDITERKRAEEALRRAHHELEQRVQERTAELTKKTHDLETLLYVTSHDLREPLRSIENFSRMVQERYAGALDEKGQDFLRRVVRGAQRMDRLMTDILDLSRAQRMELPAEEVDGHRIVEEALRRLEDKITQTGARVKVAANLPILKGNSTWATQGIFNLIANALKFVRPHESPNIEIVAYEPEQPGSEEVGFVVRDRGPGVAPEHAQRIFTLFQRAVGRDVEGTGAGLAIVRQVAERHGGRAWVQPREGGGAEFVLTFGLHRQ